MTNIYCEVINVGKIPDKKKLNANLQNREIPLKYCYLEEGADIWDKLRQSEEYSLGRKENENLEKTLFEIKHFLGNEDRNLIHIGPGQGIEIKYFLDYFDLTGNSKYSGIDISEGMIENAIKNNKISLNKNNSLWYNADVESSGILGFICKDVKNKGAKNNLLLFTNEGTLISNEKIFKELYSSLERDDYAFMTFEGDCPTKREEILSTYKLPLTLEILSVGINKAGYNPKEGKFSFSFNEQKSTAEVYFKPKGEEKILCLSSYKPKQKDLVKKLEDFGFEIPYLKFHKDLHSFAVLLKKVEN